MNYSNFSFWWIFILYCITFFPIRYFAKSFNFWPGIFDAIGIAGLSFILFYDTSPISCAIFIADIIFNYLMVSWMLRCQGYQAKLVATFTIILNILLLAYFKYYVFFVEDVIGLVFNIPEDWKQVSPLPVSNQIPPGVSFYTFQMVSFVVDSLVDRNKKPIKFIDYVNFVSFFPQIVAGPIERRQDLFPQIQNFRFKLTINNIEKGLRWVSLGFFMKFVLADNISPFINIESADNPWAIWFFTFLFTLRIYFDFAGYSFVAVGLGHFLGVKLIVNFLAPYTSQSINEFWQRWHITLSTWFRDYVFLPLMRTNKQRGKDKAQIWPSFCLFITFTLSGFWHGAAWNFILWGAYHGALLLVLRYLGRPFYGWAGKYLGKAQFISWLLTMFSVILGCLFFMDTDSRRLLGKMLVIINPLNYSWGNLTSFLGTYNVNELTALGVVLFLALGVLFLEHLAVWQKKYEYEWLLNRWLSPILLGLTILLAAQTQSKFIYFEF